MLYTPSDHERCDSQISIPLPSLPRQTFPVEVRCTFSGVCGALVAAGALSAALANHYLYGLCGVQLLALAYAVLAVTGAVATWVAVDDSFEYQPVSRRMLGQDQVRLVA